MKVGDKVRIIRDEIGMHSHLLGMKGEIVDISKNGFHQVYLPKYSYAPFDNYFSDNELELLKEE